MKYFAMINGEQRGPFALNELIGAGVTPDTYVWCKEMTGWEKAEDVADVCRYFRQHLTGGAPEDIPVETPEVEEIMNETPSPRSFGELRGTSSDSSGQPNFLEDNEPLEQKPGGLMLIAILSALLCFLPTGIAAIYFAWRVEKEWQKGDMKACKENVRRAKMLIGITFFIGFIIMALMMSVMNGVR